CARGHAGSYPVQLASKQEERRPLPYVNTVRRYPPDNQIFCSFQWPHQNSRTPATAIAASAITIEKNTPFDAKPARSLWKSNRPITTLPDKLAKFSGRA